MKKRNIVLSLLLLGVVVFGIFYNTTLKDQWHVWDSGIRWLQSHTGTKYTSTNEAVEGSYSVELNLADLESNHGKKIFEQGRNHSIVVESIEKISEGLGFASFSHFNKIFKKRFSVTPAVLRKTGGIWTA